MIHYSEILEVFALFFVLGFISAFFVMSKVNRMMSKLFNKE